MPRNSIFGTLTFSVRSQLKTKVVPGQKYIRLSLYISSTIVYSEETDKKNMKMNLAKVAMTRLALVSIAIAGMISSASAVINMTTSFQPIIDIIGVITGNSDSWIGLIVLGVEITIALAVGYFVRGIMSKATGHGK